MLPRSRQEVRFWKSFALLIIFVAREGHACVPTGHVEQGVALGTVIQTWRKTRDTMRADQRRLLEALPSWTWSVREAAFKKRFDLLSEYISREGHACVPQQHIEGGVALGLFVYTQRQFRASMPQERRALLEGLPGWVWHSHDEAFDRGFAALRLFAEREGHVRVPCKHIEGGARLGVFIQHQRQARHTMSAERRALLEALPGWSWSRKDDAFRRNVETLRRFVEREGHARVPQKHMEDGIQLGLFVSNQRRSRDLLSKSRRELLESFPGWVWSARPKRDTARNRE
jgi:hypothetical protein